MCLKCHWMKKKTCIQEDENMNHMFSYRVNSKPLPPKPKINMDLHYLRPTGGKCFFSDQTLLLASRCCVIIKLVNSTMPVNAFPTCCISSGWASQNIHIKLRPPPKTNGVFHTPLIQTCKHGLLSFNVPGAAQL